MLLGAPRGVSSPDVGEGVGMKEGFLEELMVRLSPDRSEQGGPVPPTPSRGRTKNKGTGERSELFQCLCLGLVLRTVGSGGF